MQFNKQTKIAKSLENCILKVALSKILQNIEWTKQITYLSKVTSIHYSTKSVRQKKLTCIKCKKNFDNILIFILHLQLQHSLKSAQAYNVSKYQIFGDTLMIYSSSEQNTKFQNIDPSDFLLPLPKDGCYIFGSFSYRVNTILDKISKKICRKYQNSNNRVYFHSTDIFRTIGNASEDDDSQDDIGTVQRQLQQLRIRQFTDVNEIDKKFFIQWNTFTHRYKQKVQIIYPQALTDLLKNFATHIALTSNIDIRINLMMHLWTLWSLGQITSDEVLKILDKYDQVRKQNLLETSKQKY